MIFFHTLGNLLIKNIRLTSENQLKSDFKFKNIFLLRFASVFIFWLVHRFRMLRFVMFVQASRSCESFFTELACHVSWIMWKLMMSKKPLGMKEFVTFCALIEFSFEVICIVVPGNKRKYQKLESHNNSSTYCRKSSLLVYSLSHLSHRKTFPLKLFTWTRSMWTGSTNLS